MNTDHPDALICPETAMPFFFQDDALLSDELRAFARETATPLLFGGPAYGLRQPGLTPLHNRAFFLDAQGRNAGRYDKEHLVPFGEYLPPGLDSPLFASLFQGLGGSPPALLCRPSVCLCPTAGARPCSARSSVTRPCFPNWPATAWPREPKF